MRKYDNDLYKFSNVSYIIYFLIQRLFISCLFDYKHLAEIW